MGEARVFTMPDLGEGLEEGEIVGWLVVEGDAVTLNQPLVEIETAKATVEVPSPFAGVVTALHGTVGTVVAVGAPLVTFGGVPGAEEDVEAASDETPAAPAPVAPASAGVPASAARATPPVRRLAKELGVDLGSLTGSGPDGRVTADDVRRAGGGDGDREPSRGVIAQNLERQAAIPQVTTFRTIDCSALEAFRGDLGVSPLPIAIAALCRTIESHPRLNAWWSDGRVEERREVHVGVAADTDRGLVVPVLRDAPASGIAAIAETVGRLASSARSGSLAPQELSGATIAVSNTGSYGSESGTPILSPGTGITLALGVIEPRALVVDGEVVALPACTLSCTFDHRVLDGAAVGRALTDLVGILTSADRLGELPR